MGFTLRRVGPKDAPWLVCDHCHQPINEVSKANVLWNKDDYSDLMVVHRECDRPKKHFSQSLAFYLACLLGNCNYDRQEAERERDLLSEIV